VWQDGEQIAGPFDEVKGVQYTGEGRPAFAVKRAKSWTWVVSGKEEPVTGSDTRRVAVAGARVAYDVKGPLGWSLVVDGKAGPVFDAIVTLDFSPDGTRFAYLGVRKNTIVPVVDGKEEPAHANVDGIRFSGDSKRLAYVAMDTAKKEGVVGRIVLDGVPGRAHPALLLNLEADLRAAYFDLKTFGLWRPPGLRPILTGTSAPIFRADGKLLYAGSAPGAAESVWLEGEDKPLFQPSFLAAGPVLSAKEERIGWVENLEGQWAGFVDGQRGPSAPTVNNRVNDASDLTLSPDGSRIAFVHIAGGGSFARGMAAHALRRVVVTGGEEKTYDAGDTTNLQFSADGSRFAYVVHEAKGFEHPGSKNGSFVVLDGFPGRVYSNVLPGTLRFMGPDAVSYVARLQDVKDGPYRYYRVTQTLPAAKP
jgi:dipeptidyl aminopeptidase/acylaminoacyl peptidase